MVKKTLTKGSNAEGQKSEKLNVTFNYIRANKPIDTVALACVVILYLVKLNVN